MAAFYAYNYNYLATKLVSYWEKNGFLIRGQLYAVRCNGQWYIAKWIGVRFQIEDDSGHKEDLETKSVNSVVQLPT